MKGHEAASKLTEMVEACRILEEAGIDILSILMSDARCYIQCSSITMPIYIKNHTEIPYNIKRITGDDYDYCWLWTAVSGIECGCAIGEHTAQEISKERTKNDETV